MTLSRIRAAVLVCAGALGLAGCSTYGGGVSLGYGNGGYYDDDYGSRYGYGYASPSGWYGDHYYPGTGYYVYDRSGDRRRWSDSQRRYWEARRGNRELRENRRDYRSDQRQDRREYRRERREDRQAVRSGAVARPAYRADRREDRAERRQERRDDRRDLRRSNRRDRRD